MVAEQVPLYSIEAEKSVLGAMLLSELESERLVRMLEPKMFFNPAHRGMFKQMSELVLKRVSLDFVTVRAALESSGILAEIGGEDYLLEVAEYVPSAAGAEFYGEIVKDKYRLRSLRERCAELAKGIETGDLTADQAWATAGDLPRGLEPGARDLFLASEIDLSAPKEAWVPCGIKCLDAKGVGGGIFPKGELSMVGALTGHGKTAMGTQTTAHLLVTGHRVLYATLEMSAAKIKGLIVRTLCGWDEQPRSLETLEVWDAANKLVDRSRLVIWDPSERDAEQRTVETLVQQAVKIRDTSGLDVVIVDYGQLFSSNKTRRSDNRTNELVAVANALFNLAKRLHIPVICLAQLRVEKGDDPKIADCAQFQKNSAMTIFFTIARPEEDPLGYPTWRGNARIVKTRNGNYGRLPLNFRWGYARFEDPEAPLPAWEYDPFADE
jgi:replicative DNA helicase